jgi:uncharacterized membrane protein YcaP (DUF421 family)
MLDDLFLLPVPAGEKVLRAALVYAFLVVALRVVGKRELGQFNTLDLVVLLLVANAVQNGIIGADNSVTGAFIGAGTLFVVNEALNRLTFVSPWAERLIEGAPSYLIEHGTPVRRALLASGVSLTELRSIARRQGFDDLGDVETAILETSGVVSMFRAGENPEAVHPAEPGGMRIGKRRRARR